MTAYVLFSAENTHTHTHMRTHTHAHTHAHTHTPYVCIYGSGTLGITRLQKGETTDAWFVGTQPE